jgi:hypothetical protein
MTSAALDIIICAVLLVYIVPSIFDRQTTGLIDLAIIVLGLTHIARRIG